MPLDTLIFDPTPCGFPRPRVPVQPVGLDGLSLNPPAPWAPAEHFRHFARGRYALREAYGLSGIGPGRTLLAPSYHCRTMLDPALALGGELLLYPLRPDLAPDLAALDTLADQSAAPVRALLATHFFGIPRDFSGLAAWCAGRNIALIEDASHTLFCEHHRPTGIGELGEFVVSSPYKFLPSPDGGLLYACDADRLKSLSTLAPSLFNELRGLNFFWSRAKERRRNRTTLDPARIDTELAAIAADQYLPAIERHEPTGTSADYQPDDEGCAALRYSRMLYRHLDIDSITRRRRVRYRQWATATTNLPNCRPLQPVLPEDCIPYMFPLYIDQPEPHFYWLKQLGLPLYRWDSIVISGCPIADDYRLHLLQVPCHQSLNDNDMDWMIAAFSRISACQTALADVPGRGVGVTG